MSAKKLTNDQMIQGLYEMVTGLNMKVDGLDKKVDKLDDKVNKLDNKVERYQEENRRQFAGLTCLLESVNHYVENSHEKRITALEKHFKN